MKRLHRIITTDDGDHVADRDLPTVSEWVSIGPEVERNVTFETWPVDGNGAVLDRGSMTFDFEILERIKKADVAPEVGAQVVIPGDGICVDTESGSTIPMRKIVYRAKGVALALRISNIANTPPGFVSLVITYEVD